MKKIFVYILSLMMLVLPMSCEEALDINTDPQAATSADPNAVLPYVFVQYAARKTTEIGTRITDVPQHFARTFNSPRNGSTTSFLTGNTWNMYYTQVLGNLGLVEADAREAGTGSNNITAIAVIMQALSYYELTVIFEDIPFSESINGQEFPLPEFDDQGTVLRGCVDLLNEAMALIDEFEALGGAGTFNVSSGDLIFGGDMQAWRRFANSLKIRILMLIRNVDASVESDITAAFNQPLIESNAQATLFNYPGDPGQDNAWKQILVDFGTGFNASSEFFGPSPFISDLLTSTNDPRFELFVDTRGGLPPPALDRFPTGSNSVINDNVMRADMPNIWFLPSELNLYRAELIIDGVLSGDADEAYRTGVEQAVTFWGQDINGAQITLTSSQIDTYVNSIPDLSTLSNEDAKEQIYTQQYLESFLRPLLSWTHVRRTGVPALDPPASATISTILKRFTYPPTEAAANPNTPTDVLTDEPMWFENM
ncbi:MAG: SusD/RagB family nutrient-binding outer membrane lipoprotein [Bacteroidota bacterium]